MLGSQKCITDGFITKSIARAPHPPAHLHVHSLPGSHGPEPLMMFHWIQPKKGFSDRLLGCLVRATIFSNEKNQLSSISQCYWSSLNKLPVLLKIFRNHNKIGRARELKLTPLPPLSRLSLPSKAPLPLEKSNAPWKGSLPASHTACPPAGQPVMPAGSAWILTDCFSCWPRTPWLAGAASGFIMKKHMLNWIYTSCTNLSRRQVILYSMKLKGKGGEKKEGGGKTGLQLKVSLLLSLKTLHTWRQKRNQNDRARLHFYHAETLTLRVSDKAEGTSPGLQASERTRSFLRLKNKRQKKRGKKAKMADCTQIPLQKA